MEEKIEEAKRETCMMLFLVLYSNEWKGFNDLWIKLNFLPWHKAFKINAVNTRNKCMYKKNLLCHDDYVTI